MPLVIDKFKSKKGASVSDELANTEIQFDISDFPFVQNTDYQYSVSYLDILKY